MPRLNVSKILNEKQEQRVKERPKVEQEARPVRKKKKNAVPASSPKGEIEYTQYSTIAAAYARGEMPKRHAALYWGIRKALGDGVLNGEINMGLVLEDIDMTRKSCANILRHLENFGFLEHERRPRGTYIEILK